MVPEPFDVQQTAVTTHLPPGLVGLLNALYWGSEEFEGELDAFLDTWKSVKGWHAFHGAYSVNDAEQRNLDNFVLLWESVQAQLDQDEIGFENFAGSVYETVSIMEQLNEDRKFPHYSPIPAVNEILLAGAAFCMERGSAQGVRDRLPLLSECVDNMRGLFFEQQYRLPEGVQAALLEGFELMESGLRAVHEGLPEKAPTQDGLADIKEGASLTEFLLEWDRKERQRLNEQYSRFNIPVIGTELEIAYESARSVERRKWRRGAKSTEEDLFPRLDDFWSAIKPHLFVMPDERVEVFDNIDQSIEELKMAVAAMKENEGGDEEVMESLLEALEWVSESFSTLEELTLKPETFADNSPERNIFEAARGILAGTVPDAVLVELLKANPLSQEATEAFSVFVNEGDAEAMVAAVWFLFDAVEARQEGQGQSGPWSCSLCGFRNEADSLSCRECRVVRKTV